MSSLKVSKLSKKFGTRTILNDISLECSTNEILGIFGRNGSGKSTLLQTIFNTVKADTIELRIDGRLVEPNKVISANKIGYLPQHTFLPKNLKVRDVIPLLFMDGEKQDKIFYAPNIHRITDRKIGILSLGELRYLEIMLLATMNHKFIMLDEPFSMVEPLYINVIKELLLTLKEKKGIIITDHYYKDVLEISNRNILIKDGTSYSIKNENDLFHHNYIK